MDYRKPSHTFAATTIYDSNWTKEIDTQFISCLEMLAEMLEHCVGKEDVDEYLGEVMKNFNSTFHTNFNFGDGLFQVRKLKRRLACWALILVLENQHLVKVTNVVTADDRIWEYLVGRYPFAEDYKGGIEKNAEKLQQIFGQPKVKLLSLSQEMVNHASQRNMELRVNQPQDPNRNSLFLAGEDVMYSLASDGHYMALIGRVPDASNPPMGSPERFRGSVPYASNLPTGSAGRRRATRSGDGSSRTRRNGKHSDRGSN